MSANTVPMTVPLTNGLTEDTSDLDARRPGISYAANVEFTQNGIVKARSCFENHNAFGVRILDLATGLATDVGTQVLEDTGFYPTAMFRYRDSLGERPGVAARGRVWTWEGDRFTDRLFAVSTRVDRLSEFFQYPGTTALASQNTAVSDTFAQADQSQFPTGTPLLGGVTSSVENYQPGIQKFLYGTSCNSRSAAGNTQHVTVGNTGGDNDLWMIVRDGDGQALNSFKLATNCETASPATLPGAYPKCAGNYPSQIIWIMYKQSASTNFIFLRVDPSTGAVSTSLTEVGPANVIGTWVSADGALAANRINRGYTRLGVSGVNCASYNATTLAIIPSSVVVFDSANPKLPSGPCVIGGDVSVRGPFVGYNVITNVAGTETDVVVGQYLLGSPSAGRVLRTYLGNYSAVPFTTPPCSWRVLHQPIVVQNDSAQPRVVMGLNYKPTTVTSGTGNEGSTWYVIDLSDLTSPGEVLLGGTRNPGIVAKGKTFSTVHPQSAVSAIPHALGNTDVLDYYRFPTLDFSEFSNVGGVNPSLGLNQVRFITTTAASIGEETVLAGNIPHAIARGYSSEVGFVQHSPSTAVALQAGGVLPIGSYTVQTVWRYMDEAGIVHRSAPSLPQTISTTLGNQQIITRTTNCALTEKEFGSVVVEVYCTDTNPTANSLKYLIKTGSSGAGQLTTLNVGTLVTIDTTARPLYTAGGVVFANTPVSADGGCATVNKRMWMSNGTQVFASKPYKADGNGPAWNDEGVLQVVPPAPAGRVVALEALDDKLVILCERGIYVTQGDGPDDAGNGPDFLFPVQVSTLGVSNERASCVTAAGVVFHAANTQNGPEQGYGGLYLLDHGLGVKPLGLPAMSQLFTDVAVDLSYVPERELLLTNLSDQLLMLDMRSNNFAVWTTPASYPTCFGTTEAGGVLWVGYRIGDSFSGIGAYTGSSGIDDLDVPTVVIETNQMFANTQDGLSWSRVRGVSLLGEPAAHTLTMTVTSDQSLAPMVSVFNMVPPGVDATWPTNRYAPEFRLPNQKCSELKVRFTATPCMGAWSALRLDIQPTKNRAPTNKRQ